MIDDVIFLPFAQVIHVIQQQHEVIKINTMRKREPFFFLATRSDREHELEGNERLRGESREENKT